MFTRSDRSGSAAPRNEQQLSIAPSTATAPGASPSRSIAERRTGSVVVAGSIGGNTAAGNLAAARIASLQRPVSRSMSMVRDAHVASSASAPHSSRIARPRRDRKRCRSAMTSGFVRHHHRKCSRDDATAGSQPVRSRSSAALMSTESATPGPSSGRLSAGARAGPRARPWRSTGTIAVPRQLNTSVRIGCRGHVAATPAMSPSIVSWTASAGYACSPGSVDRLGVLVLRTSISWPSKVASSALMRDDPTSRARMLTRDR